jgi:hypothetical protein
MTMSRSESRKPPSVARGTGADAERVRQRLAGFDWETSDAWMVLQEHFGPTIKSNEIRSIANLICRKIPGLRLDRDAIRDGRVLVKWYQENLVKVKEVLQYIDLRDGSERVIGSQEI